MMLQGRPYKYETAPVRWWEMLISAAAGILIGLACVQG